jgi:hypothetical protein
MNQISQTLAVETIASGRARSLRSLEWFVGVYAVFLVIASILLFLMNAASDQVNNLIIEQNAAALKLWTNVDYYQHHHPDGQNADTSLPPGLFEDLVEFSRRNATIIKTVHRLSLANVLSPGSSWEQVRRYILPTDGRQPPPGQDYYFDHLGVDPRTTADNVFDEAMYQIELYQAIRDYAQDKSNFYKGFIGAISAYLLPVAYALLGAFLYAFRSSCANVRQRRADPSLDRTSRFLMAGIAGVAISALSSLIPQELLLSPLAAAFIIGYSIDVLVTRLDGYIRKLQQSAPS